MSELKRRGLSDDFMADLLSGKLNCFLSAVKNDDTLCLEIREDYISIYYRGGWLFKISAASGDYKIGFGPAYANSSNKKSRVEQMKSFSPDLWVENIPFLKSVMDECFVKSPKSLLEKEFQQLILRENNNSRIANDTDYFIADIEYANSDNGSQFDMVALKWLSTSAERKKKANVPIAFIEVKYGDGALKKSGIIKHTMDIYKFLSLGHDKNLRTEMLKVFNQKVELGLAPAKPGAIESISDERPELIFIFANHKPASTILMDELRAIDYDQISELCDIKIASASLMGYGLYADCMIPLHEYLKNN